MSAVYEFVQLSRNRLLVVLTVVQAVTFLFLVSLFGMTGAYAPTAVVDYDRGAYSQALMETLASAHHSFSLRPMDEERAIKEVQRGNLVAVIIVPKGFTDSVSRGTPAVLKVIVDNIDTDMTDDIQRALPSAIVAFGAQSHLPGIHVQVMEKDLIDHDTDFIPYLVVSGIVMATFTISGILAGVSIAREFETGTAQMLQLTPINPMIVMIGRVLATSFVSFLATLLTVAVLIFGYHITPAHPLELIAALIFCLVIFGLVGCALGASIKRTMPVASFVFAISLPLYMVSGSYEPERFDGNVIWGLAHLSPVYYAVGILEHAVHNLHVTPESVAVNFLALAGWAVLALVTAALSLRPGVRA
jgi:ABC-2 type transport system permease protein